MSRVFSVKHHLQNNNKAKGFALGLFLTALLAAAARLASELPGLTVLGPLVLAIVLGMLYRHLAGQVPSAAETGVSFAGKKLLRLGIILLGMRLNLSDIWAAGPKVLAIDAIHIAVTIPLTAWIAARMGAGRNLGLLTACGTGICGAAAVAAISPQLKAKDEETAVAAAVVAILGTLFTIAYTVLYPVLGLSPAGYGIFTGSTLHEVAHVLAAAAPGGQEAVDMAVVAKLARVAMLMPAALLIGLWTARRSTREEGARLGRWPPFHSDSLVHFGISRHGRCQHAGHHSSSGWGRHRERCLSPDRHGDGRTRTWS